MEFTRRGQKQGLEKIVRLAASSVVSKAAQEAKIAAGGPLAPGILARFIGYFVNRKKRYIFLAICGLLLYFAQKKGYTGKLLAYSLKKAEERIQKAMENQQLKMQNSMDKSSAFSKSYKDTIEKLPSLLSNRMKIILTQKLGFEKLKEQLRNKSLPAAEKTKCWQAFRVAVLQGAVLIPVLKSYLTLVYSDRKSVV